MTSCLQGKWLHAASLCLCLNRVGGGAGSRVAPRSAALGWGLQPSRTCRGLVICLFKILFAKHMTYVLRLVRAGCAPSWLVLL
jgi:hypothetical protein